MPSYFVVIAIVSYDHELPLEDSLDEDSVRCAWERMLFH
jgi:hypothetical protein